MAIICFLVFSTIHFSAIAVAQNKKVTHLVIQNPFGLTKTTPQRLNLLVDTHLHLNPTCPL